MTRQPYRRYSEAIRQAIVKSGNANLYPDLHIPRSTAYHWIKRGEPHPRVKPSKKVAPSNPESTLKVLKLFIRTLKGKVDLSALSSSEKIELSLALRTGRFKGCLPPSLANQLRDQVYQCLTSYDGLCIKRYPVRLAAQEFAKMKELYEAPQYAHMAVCSLATLAKRKGWVKCSTQTWYRYIKKFGWRRFLRVCNQPKKRKRGLHAKAPHQMWHIDVTQIPLLNGKHCCLQVIIDNYSRYIIAWKVSWTISRRRSQALLKPALKEYGFASGSCLVSDGGPENSQLGTSVRPSIYQRIARKEIRSANTMVEVFFKTLKHDFLKYQKLHSIQEARSAVKFFIEQHNYVIPRVALQGRTPVEVIAGKQVVVEEAQETMKERVSLNRASHCLVCRRTPTSE